MVQWIVRSIPNDGHIELFLILASSSVCDTGHGMYYPVCGMVDMKDPLIRKNTHIVVTAGFLSHSLSGSLPYV